MIHVVSEMHVSSNGYRLLLRAGIAKGRLVVEMSSNGYGYPGRSPIAFSALTMPFAKSVRVMGANYSSGLPIRDKARIDFEAHLLQVLRAFVERRPEVFLHPSFVVRRRIEEAPFETVVVETSMGDVHLSRHGDGAIAEMLILSGSLSASRRGRELLAKISQNSVTWTEAWALDAHGPRRPCAPDATELAILGEIARRLPGPTESLSFMEPEHPAPPAIDYSGLRVAELPADAVAAHGVLDTDQLVDKVNRSRSTRGLPPIPRGSYPSNMIKLRAFLRLAAKELRAP